MEGDQGPAAGPAGPPGSLLLSDGAYFAALRRRPDDPDFFLEALQLQEDCEGLTGLVSLVGSASRAAAMQASWALSRLADGGDAACDDIVAAGAPEVLTLALHRREIAIAVWAALALGRLAADGEGAEARRDAIAGAGATEALAAALLRAVHDRDLACMSLRALYYLVSGDGEGADARRSAIVAAGAAALVAALSLDEAVAGLAAKVLAELASGVEGADARRSALLEAGAARALVAALTHRSDAVVVWAALALTQLATYGEGADARRSAIVDAGAAPALANALHRGRPTFLADFAKYALCMLAAGRMGVAERCAAISAAISAADEAAAAPPPAIRPRRPRCSWCCCGW